MPRRRSTLLVCLLAFSLVGQPVAACQPDAEASLAALNQLRQMARSCGTHRFEAAEPVRWSPALLDTATQYARELAQRDRIDHEGEAATSLRRRLSEAGYTLKTAGENLAGGPETLAEAIAVWLASPGHCENLMWPGFSEIGLACVTGPGQLQRYWVLHLAEPWNRPPATGQGLRNRNAGRTGF